MRWLSQISLQVFLFIPGIAFPQNLLPDSTKLRVESILSTRGEAYIALSANVRKSFLAGIPDLTPDKQTDSLIYFYINSEQFRMITDAGIEFRVFTAPSMLAPVRMAVSLDEVLSGQGYPTYQQYLDLMRQFRDDYPELCKIDTIGYSVGGKLILAARIEKGNYIEGDRPLVFYSSTMHGDEVVGYSLMLMLINDILKNSVESTQIASILDDLVVIINPLANPDGTYFLSDTSLYGAIRGTLKPPANGINDLNRNFHDVRLGMSYTYSGLQKENLEMVKYMEKYSPSLSANFHTGAEVLNYPWDSWYPNERIHADNDWFIEICRDYVDFARSIDPSYLRLYPEGYVFGSVWYRISGGRQDFVTYNLRGRELTIELSEIKLPDVSQIPGFWVKNHSALINLIEKAGDGIFGTISDSSEMESVAAKVEIPGYDTHESHVYSHAATGKFFRYLPEGNYNLQITANGYRPKTIVSGVTKNQRTELDIRLIPIHSEIRVKTVPGNHEIIIELIDDESEVFFADLFDLSGRKVQEKIFIGNTGTIGGPMFHGIYILKVKSEHQVLSRLVFF